MRWPALLMLLLPGTALAMDLAVFGSWSLTIDSSDLQAGAGSDLLSVHESGASQVTVDVVNSVDASDSWRVDVRRADTTWSSGIRVEVRRDGAGLGDGSVSGGTEWTEVTDLDTSFFTGSGDRTDIGIQLRISGMSVQVSPDTLSTQVTFTIVDT